MALQVERHFVAKREYRKACRQLFTGPKCFLCIVGRFFVGYRPAMYILGGYEKGLMVFSAAVCIKQD